MKKTLITITVFCLLTVIFSDFAKAKEITDGVQEKPEVVYIEQDEPVEEDKEPISADIIDMDSPATAEKAEKEDRFSFSFIDIDINRMYLYEEMAEDIKRLETSYPDLVKTEIIGQSADNRNIYLIKLGKGGIKSVMLGGVHAREISATPLLIKMINEYCKGYYTKMHIDGYDVKELLDATTLYIVPSVNPDGMEIAIKKETAIRNDNLRAAFKAIPSWYNQWKANARGVDLNRNFASQYWGYNLAWGVAKSSMISSEPHAEYFAGNFPASESETQSIQNLIKNNDFKILFDLHSKGRVIYWHKPTKDDSYNSITHSIAQGVSKVSGYTLLPNSISVPGNGTDGTTTDYASENGMFTLTIQLLPLETTFPVSVYATVNEWDKIKLIGLVLAAETARLSPPPIKETPAIEENLRPHMDASDLQEGKSGS